jgi:hypothetical protein
VVVRWFVVACLFDGSGCSFRSLVVFRLFDGLVVVRYDLWFRSSSCRNGGFAASLAVRLCLTVKHSLQLRLSLNRRITGEALKSKRLTVRQSLIARDAAKPPLRHQQQRTTNNHGPQRTLITNSQNGIISTYTPTRR